MINWMKASTTKISDYTVGSVARTLIEAPAMEIDELYQQMFVGIKEAIPVAVYNSFDFDRIEAVSATGLIRIIVEPASADAVIEAGTTFTGTGLSSTYSSLENTKVAAGASYVDVQTEADTTGTAGNISAGESFTLSPSPSNFSSATNPAAFVNGSEEETDSERKLRFAAYIDAINRSTKSGIVYGLKTANLTDSAGNITEQVIVAVVVEPYVNDSVTNPIAMVTCYIHNGVGSTTVELVAQAQTIVDGYTDTDGTKVAGYKAAGIPCTVYAATETAVDITGVLVEEDGYDHATLVASASSAIYAYIQALDIGASCLYAELIAVVMAIEGIYNFTLSAPTADTAAAEIVKLMPGEITIS
jgi:uncharacterized phage protein gp47/JayE